MTLTQWNAREDLQLALKELMEGPVLKQALDVLVYASLPGPTIPPEGVAILEHNAIMNARREGYYEFLRNLEKLTSPVLPAVRPPLKPWQPTTRE